MAGLGDCWPLPCSMSPTMACITSAPDCHMRNCRNTPLHWSRRGPTNHALTQAIGTHYWTYLAVSAILGSGRNGVLPCCPGHEINNIGLYSYCRIGIPSSGGRFHLSSLSSASDFYGIGECADSDVSDFFHGGGARVDAAPGPPRSDKQEKRPESRAVS
jgi:hypothetical protein